AGSRRAPAGSYRDLDIYVRARALIAGCHELSLRLPKFEMYEEGSQLRRAVKAIGANIVEGYGRRRYTKDYLRFLTYAHASCDEAIYHLEVLRDTGSAKAEDVEALLGVADVLGRQIHRFIQSVREQHKPG
ncbi:MAG: four helix bundle protein, partial [Armatimonadota bacterium]